MQNITFKTVMALVLAHAGIALLYIPVMAFLMLSIGFAGCNTHPVSSCPPDTQAYIDASMMALYTLPLAGGIIVTLLMNRSLSNIFPGKISGAIGRVLYVLFPYLVVFVALAIANSM